MGIIQVDLFLTLDGVHPVPGGSGEGRVGRLRVRRLAGAYFDDASGETIGAHVEGLDALLLGRRTYDICAGCWPTHGDDDPIAAKFDAVPKFVVSRTLTDPSWEGTTVSADVAPEVRALEDQFDEVHVSGSGNIVRTLLREGLLGRLNFVLRPLTSGSGERLFGAGIVPAAFTVVEAPQVFPKGAISLVHERVGDPLTGVENSRLPQ